MGQCDEQRAWRRTMVIGSRGVQACFRQLIAVQVGDFEDHDTV